MKKLLLTLLLGLFILPFGVFAEEKVPVYFFHGDGCPHCAEAKMFFDSLESTEYGNMFEIKPYEVWNDESNARLMYAFAVINGEEDEATGVPYIVIGDKSWIGYLDSYNKDFETQIEKLYKEKAADRYDVLKIYEREKNNENSIYDFNIPENNSDDSYADDAYNDSLDDYVVEKDNLKPLKKILPILIGVGVVGILFVVGITVLIIVLVTRKKK
ncbi:MAG: hypothetical protein IKH54_07175 [Bacilli bacterium]|nr:hypothetical protein [Bacilli bacterium]MBR6137525.1 hypothetical protein [Bacilli bacterium]MBR6949946.1 hypothetical protein [Bacilli bacterium]